MRLKKVIKKYLLMIESDRDNKDKIFWNVFSDKTGGYWGSGRTLKTAVKNWAKKNNIILKRRENE